MSAAVRNTARAWGGVAKTFHWVMAGLIGAMFVLGTMAATWHMSPTKLRLFVWHKSTGILVLVLVVARIAWRLSGVRPALPEAMSRLERRLAGLVHLLLYGLMVAIPISGWVINSAANLPLKVYGLFRLPNLVGPSKAVQVMAETAHLTLIVVLALLLALHIGAALRHQYWLGDDTLRRMLPWGGP